MPRSVGAEIFASAGSVEKREFLRRLGAQHVVDSRSLAFADDIREITDGEGVDVVLNSVAGEAIHKGLSILRPYGRFVELGKRDFYANSKLGLQPFRNNIQFFGVDVDRLLVDRPALSRQLFAELAPLLDQRVFVPLPHRVFPIARAVEAFRCMQHSRHIGKIVLAMDGVDRPAIAPVRPETGLQLSPDGELSRHRGPRRVRPRDRRVARPEGCPSSRGRRAQRDHPARCSRRHSSACGKTASRFTNLPSMSPMRTRLPSCCAACSAKCRHCAVSYTARG